MIRLVTGPFEGMTEQQYDAWRANLGAEAIETHGRLDRHVAGLPNMARHPGLEPKPWKGGLLYGPAGVGKTREALARILDPAINPRKRCFMPATEYVELSRDLELARDGEYDLFRVRQARCGRWTVLDDLGARRQSDFAEDVLLRLLDYRWNEDLPTLVTSNSSPDELARVWGDRIVSRILGMGAVERMTGPDRRLTP